MTSPVITFEGLEIQTFDEVFQEIAEGFRAIYGQDINLDADVPDGQRTALQSQIYLDLQIIRLLYY